MCVLVNKNLYGKLFLSLELPTTFVETFKILSVLFFIQILICPVDNWTILDLKCCNESFYIDIILRQYKRTILLHSILKKLKCFISLLQQ